MAQCPTASFPFSPSPQNHQHFLKGTALEACPSLFFSFFPPSVPFIFSRGGSKRRGLWRRTEPDSVSPRSFLCFLLSETLLWKNSSTTSERCMFSYSSHRKLVPTCPPLTQCYPQASVINLTYPPSHECFLIILPDGFLSSLSVLSFLPSLPLTLGARPEVLNSILTWCLSPDSSFIHSH